MLVGRDARTVYVGATTGHDQNDNQIPGTIEVFWVAADGSLALVQTVLAPPRQMLLTPDGGRLIEWDDYGLVVSFPIQSDGRLGAAHPNPSVTGSARALAVGPDGSTLYVATYPQQLEQYAIGIDGTLTARTPSEVGLYGCRADFLGITPDGSQLDASLLQPGDHALARRRRRARRSTARSSAPGAARRTSRTCADVRCTRRSTRTRSSTCSARWTGRSSTSRHR